MRLQSSRILSRNPCVFVTTLNTFSSAQGAVLNRNRRTVALRNPVQESS